ncbi:MAG: dienelactone hydrolase family protein [Dehalococcoidia bacterium]|nr:dienelactone hydrolase family protein [Dehalococcoidia bacterium]
MTIPTSTKRALTAAILAMVLFIPASYVGAQTAGFVSPPVFSKLGVAYVVFLGGSIEELEGATAASGASGAWAQDTTGRFSQLAIGGPSFVSDRFRATYAAGFAGPTAIVLIRSSQPSPPGATPTPTPPKAGSWTTTSAPSGVASSSAEWIAVAAPDGKTILANVIRPDGAGPFPVVVLLHGQSGFSTDFLSLGKEIADAGNVVLVGCWFAGNYDGASDPDAPTPVTLPEGIPCPDGPTLKAVTSPAAVDDVAALVAAAKTLSGVRSDRVGLVGNSRGSIVGLLTGAISTESIQAIVAIGGAPPGGVLLAAQITESVLLLQGDADSVVPVVNAQSLEAGLLALGRTVQSHYYPNHGHGILFDTPLHGDAVTRTTTFLREQLGN